MMPVISAIGRDPEKSCITTSCLAVGPRQAGLGTTFPGTAETIHRALAGFHDISVRRVVHAQARHCCWNKNSSHA
jgi:hypothetical protein